MSDTETEKETDVLDESSEEALNALEKESLNNAEKAKKLEGKMYTEFKLFLYDL